MSIGESRFKYLFDWIVAGGVRADHDVDNVRKIKMINVVSLRMHARGG